jgi:hypothetical protein
MNRTGTAIAESRQAIRDCYAAFSRLCASVARADEAIAKSRRIIEQYQASIPAIMDMRQRALGRSSIIIKRRERPQRKKWQSTATIAARIVQSFRETGFDCELLSPLTLH